MSQRKRYTKSVYNTLLYGRIYQLAILIIISLATINVTYGAENVTVEKHKYSILLNDDEDGFKPIVSPLIKTASSSTASSNKNNNTNNNNKYFNSENNNSDNFNINNNNNNNKNDKNDKNNNNKIKNISESKNSETINEIDTDDNFNFFKNGIFEVFNPIDNDNDDGGDVSGGTDYNHHHQHDNKLVKNRIVQNKNRKNLKKKKPNEKSVTELQEVVLKYVDKTLNKKSYEIISGLNIELYNKSLDTATNQTREFPFLNRRSFIEPLTFQDKILIKLKEFAENHVVNVNIPRAMESTGRLFFFKGIKKIMWPILIGVQIIKTVLLALFLPSIIGSLGKIVGKGITSVSGFNHPSETVQDFEFKDNLEQDKYNEYAYPQADATTNNAFATQMYDATSVNNALSRFGMGGQKITYVNTANNGMTMMNVKKDNFKTFQDIPSSSMLLTNYDPFYSPLLSRLDAVYQQLGLGMGNEICREKLVCLMYGNPAKYAPYSNLVSAQLSRELNELRKPTSDNPDILRFFKYMRAAKDGQDGISCEENYKDCTTLNDSDGPAMITTYNDINKLVQARKL